MKDKDLRLMLISMGLIGLISIIAMVLLSSCSKEPNTKTLKVVIEPAKNITIAMPEFILDGDTFQYLLTEDLHNWEFTEAVGSHYEFKYTLDTFDNVKSLRLYENNRMIGEVNEQGETINIKK